MLCQNCQKRIANVHFTQVINNKKVEMYLCEQCANEQREQFSFGSPLNINDFFSGILGFVSESQYRTNPPENLKCEKCGMSYDEFQKSGKVGCNNCYELFQSRLDPLLKRLHGNVEHHGKIPVKLSKCINATKEIERLKEGLNKAIRSEEYEKAAEIRDRIKDLEANSEC